MDKKQIRSQIDFVEALFKNFLSSVTEHMDNQEFVGALYDHNYMNKNCGKYALKRKITLLRQELLNLEKMIDSE